ncbi:probable disease resistance protein At4g27220 [Hevea brasiliensis]|uniref:probable disease resistance protein At4g27220 n=1 Tax=Hevea brasiliensis TaxID=3981 RepID=UPI0025DF44D0|nr:probable disease resistance protein At4g27220 [Hevea brasiliensis]
MALQIMKDSGVRAMIESCKGLKELPEEGIWTGDLVRVSLRLNCIEEIASNHSPRCPNLSTLLLDGNFELRRIADSFFKHLHGLKVLDLSNTGIQNLPNSVTTLVNLASLVVRGCRKLRRVPSLANLRELKRLDLRSSGVEEVPDGLEFLSKLMYLDLEGTSVKEIRPGILPKLSHLQFLKLPLTLAVEGEEVASLSKVETLYCRFHDLVGFNTFVKSMEELMIGSKFELLIGPFSQNMDDPMFLRRPKFDKNVVAYDCSIGKEGNFLNFPADLQELAIVECNDAQSLHCVHPFRYATQLEYETQLEYVSIRKCNGMECLFLLPENGWRIFPRLKFLNLYSLENFRFLFGGEVAVAPSLPYYGNSFNQLRTFEMINCPTIKKLFPPCLLPNLQNLERIKVKDCLSMEEIIGAERQEEQVTMDFSLPKLWNFKLRNLPQLKSICDRAVICESLRLIRLIDCPGQMMDVPFFYPSGHQSFDRVEISRN